MSKQQIKSHNSNQFYLVKDLFLPNPFHMLLYLLTSVVVLVALNASKFWDYLTRDYNGQAHSLELFGSGEDGSGILGSSTSGRLGQMLVWGLVGVVIYIVIWFLKNIVTNLHNDVIADEYVHPHSYNRTKYWKSVVSRKALFVVIASVLVGYIYLVIQLLPVLISYFYQMVINFNYQNGLYGLASVASTTLLMHILVSLCRLTISAWRFIYADL